MTAEQPFATKPVNCRPGEKVTVTGVYFCSMCAQIGPIGHVSLSRGVVNRTTTRKRFLAGEMFDNSCPEHGPATGWTIEGEVTASALGDLLLDATGGCNPDVVYALIKKGADVNARKSDGSTALMCAVTAGSVDIVQVLLDRGADVNARKSDGTTALMNAAVTGQLKISRLLLDGGANVNVQKNDCGATALEIAASGGHVDMVRLLIEKGANINSKNYSGQTALVCAGLRGRVEVVELLKGVTA